MPIIYNEKTREFHHYNQKNIYIIKILNNNQTKHHNNKKRLTHKKTNNQL